MTSINQGRDSAIVSLGRTKLRGCATLDPCTNARVNTGRQYSVARQAVSTNEVSTEGVSNWLYRRLITTQMSQFFPPPATNPNL